MSRLTWVASVTTFVFVTVMLVVLLIQGLGFIFGASVDWNGLRLVALSTLGGALFVSFFTLNRRNVGDPLRRYQERTEREEGEDGRSL